MLSLPRYIRFAAAREIGILPRSLTSKVQEREDRMAAFCACCGAEITLKTEACPVCGMPRHGMLKSDPQLSPDGDLCAAKQVARPYDPQATG